MVSRGYRQHSKIEFERGPGVEGLNRGGDDDWSPAGRYLTIQIV